MIHLNCILLLMFVSLSIADEAPSSDEEAEVKLLEKLPAVKREGHSLKIKTPTGPVIFTDKPDETEQYYVSELISSFRVSKSRTDYLVAHTGWEGGSFSIINGATGAIIDVPGEPTLSPDKRRYLTSSIDLAAGYSPNVLTIIRVDDFKVEVSFDFNTPERPGGPLEARWITPAEISVVRATAKPDGEFLRFPPERIKLTNGKWAGLQAKK